LALLAAHKTPCHTNMPAAAIGDARRQLARNNIKCKQRGLLFYINWFLRAGDQSDEDYSARSADSSLEF
jgi:uncharacterized protein with NRDE domain